MNPGTLGHLAMLAFSALVAGSFSLGALVANDISPTAFNTLRFCIATVLVGGFCLVTGRGEPTSIHSTLAVRDSGAGFLRFTLC